MDKMKKELADHLLQVASERLKSVSGDVPTYNLLSLLQVERRETRTHSAILLHLLNDRNGQNPSDSFLRLFLRALNVPKKFLDGTWKVYREKTFNAGISRIDLVLESELFCAIIEMKIDACDGDCQLIRYEAIGREKGKEYLIYYLTLDGHEPEEQSAAGIDADRLRCVSFEREIILWLMECLQCVDKDGYKYAFLKQYLGAVRHITGTEREGMRIKVKDLLNSSDRLRAAQLISESLNEKWDDITIQFFRELYTRIRRKTKLEAEPFDETEYAVYIFLEKFTRRKHSYAVELYIDFNPCLRSGIIFSKLIDGIYMQISLDEAEELFPLICRKWIGELESLKGIPKIRKDYYSKYFLLEDARGALLNFGDHTAQIELIDEMNLQCKYICNDVVNRVIKPLLAD